MTKPAALTINQNLVIGLVLGGRFGFWVLVLPDHDQSL